MKPIIKAVVFRNLNEREIKYKDVAAITIYKISKTTSAYGENTLPKEIM